uniref:NAC domain-containing protein n=1 Tax=Medicago truncatula TaxID=3880 RepID=I3SLK6_MEDTR|nr:unknown [Medicago truncatula]
MGAVVECLPSPQQAEELAVLSLNKLPLGFRFRPTDEELVDFYLRMKINGNGDEVWVIREVDVCKFEPWDLPDLSIVRNKDPEWFFFCPMDRKYPNGSRLNRATTNGYWKATGKDRKIKSGATLIGMKKTLVFYAGRAPKGQRTHWIMHEYRPTLKELDGTNPGQNPYVLCRLFKKQDESLASSNCGEAEQTTSTPTTANYSPEEIQSDLNLVPLSSSLATEDERHLAAIPENSEEAMSHVITTADCYSDACNASDAQHQSLEVPAAEEDQLLNLDIFDSPRFELEPWDDKLFSPAHAHFPPEFGHQANNELIQYGTNGTDVSDFFDSCVNWDEFSSEASISLELSPNIFKIPENGSCSNSDVEMANMMNLLASHDYPEGVTLQNSDVGLFQNNSQMTLSNDFSMGQMPTVVNEYEQMWNSDTVVDGGTGIGIRSRQRQNEQPDMNQVMQAQGSAPRRIRLGGFVARSLVSETTEDGSCASEYEQSRILDTVVLGDDTGIRIRRRQRRNEEPNMNPVMQAQGSALRRIRLGGFVKHSLVSEETTKDESLQETEASENHAAAESASVLEKTSPMSAREVCEQHVTTAESNSGSKNLLLGRVRCTSKTSSISAMRSTVLAYSAIVMVSLVLLVNIWGYVRFRNAC